MSDPHEDLSRTRGLHHIEDEIDQASFEDWAAAGQAELEEFLEMHSAFFKIVTQEDSDTAVSNDESTSWPEI